MKSVPLSDAMFEGAVSVEHGDGWLKPWRIPHRQLALFRYPANGLPKRAETCSGVRLRFATDSERVRLVFKPLPELGTVSSEDAFRFDVTAAGKLLVSAPTPSGADHVDIAGLPPGRKTIELWLPQQAPVSIRALEIDDNTACRIVPDRRPKWITYGSSLTHCVRAFSPARTWPAIVARRYRLNLICLGFGGECHLDPMIGRMIRDLPADLITLKLGINCIGGSMNARTFPAAVIGLLAVVREGHPETTLGLISPIAYPPHEAAPNVVGYSIGQMRAIIEDVCTRFREHGDMHLHGFNGLDIFGTDLIARYSVDQCHPNAAGIEVMAENFERVVMRPLRAVRMKYTATGSRRGK